MGAGKLLKYLPKPTSFSVPNRSSKNLNKAATFSGPITSIFPKEARRKKKNLCGGFDTPEPTSPKVSCMGQVKHKNKNNSSNNKNSKVSKKKKNDCGRLYTTPEPTTSPKVSCMGQVKHEKKNNGSTSNNNDCKESQKIKPSAIQRMFTRKVRPGRPPVGSEVGRMRRFASGREALRDFDWRKEADEKEEEAMIVAHSAPIMMGGRMVAVEKRKEVNLWKRRTCAPPVPLNVHGV